MLYVLKAAFNHYNRQTNNLLMESLKKKKRGERRRDLRLSPSGRYRVSTQCKASQWSVISFSIFLLLLLEKKISFPLRVPYVNIAVIERAHFYFLACY